MNLETLTQTLPAIGVLALLFTWWKTTQINQAPEGSDKMAKIAASIQEGAMAFLKAEYRILLVFVIAVAALLYWSGSNNPES
ncbi:MAG: sodium/proton-translocating pyrophosphatase, partial [Verrucomicrobiota bacterium]|nr:sodium/proton-translocating pyrophosphatase [Verrucomicrobiota bacterium]